jgi:hypothetical protein
VRFADNSGTNAWLVPARALCFRVSTEDRPEETTQASIAAHHRGKLKERLQSPEGSTLELFHCNAVGTRWAVLKAVLKSSLNRLSSVRVAVG